MLKGILRTFYETTKMKSFLIQKIQVSSKTLMLLNSYIFGEHYAGGKNWRKQMWDERYNTEDYAYGIKPNKFLEANVKHIPKGRVLSIAEGEGRNALFLAKQGFSVTAVDASIVGLNKSADVMQTKKSLMIELANLKFSHLIELERDVIEGVYHTGIGAVVQAIASKKI